MTGKVLYTVKETTELTGIGMTKLYELMNAGELKSVSVGKRRYIPAESLQAFVDRLRGLQPLHASGGGVNADEHAAKDVPTAGTLSPAGVPAPPPSLNDREPQPPVDANHALRIGWVAGALMRSVEVEPLTGVKTRGVEILDDADGNHLDTIRLYAPSGTFLVTVTRETLA